MNTTIKQAYKQAPWRTQLQRLFFVAVILVIVLVVAALYLNISAQAATAGMDFQSLEWKEQDLTRKIANDQVLLGQANSEESMMARAKTLGFIPISMDKAVYVVVAGYTGRETVSFAPPPSLDMYTDPVMSPTYTQSLWDWLFSGVVTWTNAVGGNAK